MCRRFFSLPSPFPPPPSFSFLSLVWLSHDLFFLVFLLTSTLSWWWTKHCPQSIGAASWHDRMFVVKVYHKIKKPVTYSCWTSSSVWNACLWLARKFQSAKRSSRVTQVFSYMMYSYRFPHRSPQLRSAFIWESFSREVSEKMLNEAVKFQKLCKWTVSLALYTRQSEQRWKVKVVHRISAIKNFYDTFDRSTVKIHQRLFFLVAVQKLQFFWLR